MADKKEKSNEKYQGFFKIKPKGCDTYIFADKFPFVRFMVSGACQVVITNRKGNWFHVEVLKDKATKVVRAPKPNGVVEK